MITIPKEKAWFGYDSNGAYLCFDYDNSNCIRPLYYNRHKMLTDITVNDKNEIHSFNDQCALIIKIGSSFYKMWFVGGLIKRENIEKPCIMEIGQYYPLHTGNVYISDVRINLGKLKYNDHNS
jgi:hypothetical protein